MTVATGGRRPLRGWLTAEALSLTGTRVSMIAVPLFVLEETGSATRTGLVALAEMLPLVVLKALSGPIIDRLGARRVAITCDLASVVVVTAIPLLHDAGVLSFPAFLALVALAGALRGPGDAAKHAMVPALVASAGVPIERATGLASTVERTAGLFGAVLAGLLVSSLGAADALLLDAASFGLSAMVLAWSTAGLGGAPPREADPPSYAAQLREGWDFLRRDPLLLGIALMVAVTNLLDAAWASVLLPVWSLDSGEGAAVLGLLFAVFGGASALGAVCAAVWAARLPRFHVYVGAFLLCGIPRFVTLALDVPLAGVLGIFVVGGFAAGFINPVLGAVMFERIPGPLVGRVSSMTSAMCWSLMPLGGLLGGLLVDVGDLTTALLVTGVAYLAATSLPAVDPRFRAMDERPAAGAQNDVTTATPGRRPTSASAVPASSSER